MQLYLVRHAQSANNANIDQPSLRMADPPLTDIGFAQAAHLAQYLKTAIDLDRASDTLAWRYGGYEQMGLEFHRLLTSPMLRALQTVDPISKILDLPVKIWLDVHERGGLFLRSKEEKEKTTLGITREALRRDFPNFDLPQQITDVGWWRGGKEPPELSHIRARNAAEKLLSLAQTDWEDKNVVLVSHAGFLDLLLKALLMHPKAVEENQVFFFFYNTSLSRVDFRPSGHMGLRYLNRIPHLPPELVS